jgi:hypothetical protein
VLLVITMSLGELFRSMKLLLLQVTDFTAGLAIGFTFLFWKKEIIDKFRLNKNPMNVRLGERHLFSRSG